MTPSLTEDSYIIKKTSITLFPGEVDKWRMVLTLERVPKQKPLEEIRCIPRPSQLDDWALHEKIESNVVKRLGRSEYTTWTIRREDLQAQKTAEKLFKENREWLASRVKGMEAQRPNPLPLPPPLPFPPCRRRRNEEEEGFEIEGEDEEKVECGGKEADEGKEPVKGKEVDNGKGSAESQRINKGKGMEWGKGLDKGKEKDKGKGIARFW